MPNQYHQEEETTTTSKTNHSPQESSATQQKGNQKKNNTGIPDKLKAVIEHFSGFSLDEVRVHYNSEKPAEVGALAYAEGLNIYIGPGQEKHLAQELWHVVQQLRGEVKATKKVNGKNINDNKNLEQEAVNPNQSAASQQLEETAPTGTPVVQRQEIGEELGQVEHNSTRHLVSDLTSPITVGSVPKYELMQHGQEIWAADSIFTYQWEIIDNGTNTTVASFVTESPETEVQASIAGNYTVRVTVLSNGQTTSNTISLQQQVQAEDAALTTALTGVDNRRATTYRELVNDFSGYITDAANSTGAQGISPRFLASVLFIEILNRPKEEQRDPEIETVEEDIRTQERGGTLFPWDVINRSVGVGQIRLSTAAMLNGDIPWMDQDLEDRNAARDQIEENFGGLSAERQSSIFRLLKWPKSNIQTAANLLAQLKNRQNRFPNLTREEFVGSEREAGVVATEYNMGSTNSTAEDAQPSWYGETVWDLMQRDPIIRQYFDN